MRTVLPAIRPATEVPRARTEGPLRVLFIGTDFLAKGGVEAVRAVRRARAAHDLELDIVSDVPSGWLDEVEGTSGVTLHRWPADTELVRGLFERCDVLLFPSHMDTLGFVMLEALAHGMPVLASRHFATPEIVEHGSCGLLFEVENPLYGADGLCRFEHTLPPPRAFRRALGEPSEPYVEAISATLARVAGDGELHERLAAGALARVTEGALSIARRQRQLAAIYEQAVSV